MRICEKIPARLRQSADAFLEVNSIQEARDDFVFKLLSLWGGFPPATPERSDGGQVAGGEIKN